MDNLQKTSKFKSSTFEVNKKPEMRFQQKNRNLIKPQIYSTDS